MTSPAQNHEPPAISRRRVVRTAATAAWAVPAIQVATAVPAFAASGCCSATVSGSAHWRAGELNYIDIALDLVNACNTPVTGLTVTLTICDVEGITYSGDEYLPDGWTQVGKPNKELDADGNGCYTVIYMTGQSLAAGTAMHPQFTVKTGAYTGSGNSRPAGTISAVVTTSGCTSDAQAISIPAVG